MKNIIKKTSKTELYLCVALLLITFLLRFWDLGYSNFYGDETKTFYLDKTVSAKEFFMDQRKGPLQFFIVWGMEKVLGGYDEFWTRLPFAIASFLSVVVFYYLVRRLFNWQVAMVASTLFSVSGFSVAFGRTVQYQSFLMLFGLLAVCLFYEGYNTHGLLETKLPVKRRLRHLYLGGSALSLVLAFYAHYDAVFFFLPIAYLIIRGDIKKIWKPLVLHFLLPFLVLMSFFYVPYVYDGYLSENMTGYLARRITGSNFSVNYSLYTLFVYTPAVCFLSLLSLGFIAFFFKVKEYHDLLIRDMVLFWFMVPFLVLEFVILNPGTHILNYFIPLYILAGYVVWKLIGGSVFKWQKYVVTTIVTVLLLGSTVMSMRTYIPNLSNGYPWTKKDLNKYHLFLYGFPYNRGWKEIREYFITQRDAGERIIGVYTNDNDTVGEYYLHGFEYQRPGSNFQPQYQIYVYDNQEFSEHDPKFREWFLQAYELKEKIYVRNDLVAEIFKLRSSDLPPNL